MKKDNLTVNPLLKKFTTYSYVKDSNKKLREFGFVDSDVIDCSLGVNPFGEIPNLNKYFRNIDLSNISNYPNPSYPKLVNSIINYWREVSDLKNQKIYFGSGAAEVLNKLVRMLVGDGVKTLGFCPQFVEFENLVKICGGSYDAVPLAKSNEIYFRTEEFLDNIDERYDLVYIDNPINPTGEIIDIIEIEKIVKKSSSLGITVLLDEAYGDFMPKNNSAISLMEKYSNLIVLKSFSKGFGLANIRLGYAVFSNYFDKFYQMVNIPPFSFSSILSDLAIKSMEELNHLEMSIKNISINKKKFIESFQDKFIISKTNNEVPILLISSKKLSIDLYEETLKHGVIVSSGMFFRGLDANSVRIRIPKKINELIIRMDKVYKTIV